MRKLVGPLAVLLLAMTSLPACRETGTASLRGILVDVQAQDLTTTDAVVLRDEVGSLHTFRVAPESGETDHPITPSHLRAHMVRAEPVIVYYRELGTDRVAARIMDAGGRADLGRQEQVGGGP